jgi:hypothetical protein
MLGNKTRVDGAAAMARGSIVQAGNNGISGCTKFQKKYANLCYRRGARFG